MNVCHFIVGIVGIVVHLSLAYVDGRQNQLQTLEREQRYEHAYNPADSQFQWNGSYLRRSIPENNGYKNSSPNDNNKNIHFQGQRFAESARKQIPSRSTRTEESVDSQVVLRKIHISGVRKKRFAFTFNGWTQDTDKSGFTEEERQVIITIHNDLRRETMATNMKELNWDANLENVAQEWADGCDFQHNYGNDYGENLSSQPSFYNVTVAVQNWDSEKQHYTFSTHACTGVCGHYLQVVLAESSKIGCGIKYCSTMQTITSTNTYFIVCNYDPATNKGSSRPYEEGTRCSNCPADTPTCVDYLCRAATNMSASTTSTTTPVTSVSTSTTTPSSSALTLTTTPSTSASRSTTTPSTTASTTPPTPSTTQTSTSTITSTSAVAPTQTTWQTATVTETRTNTSTQTTIPQSKATADDKVTTVAPSNVTSAGISVTTGIVGTDRSDYETDILFIFTMSLIIGLPLLL